MLIELTQKMNRHLDTFKGLKKTQVGARANEALLFIEDVLEARNAIGQTRKVATQTGEMDRVWGIAVVKGVPRNLAKVVLDQIRNYVPSKGHRQVLSVRQVADELHIETVNEAPVQVVQDILDWLRGKSTGNGTSRPGKLQKWGISFTDVVIIRSKTEKVIR